jgi:hypothetical protein
MPDSPSLIATLENFGPIAEGEMELKPLTVFIGPNNSGKSYAALLLYALARVLSPAAISGDDLQVAELDPFYPARLRFPPMGEFASGDGLSKELLEFFGNAKRSPRVARLPIRVKEAFERLLSEYMQSMAPSIEQSLEDYFGVPNASMLKAARRVSGAMKISMGGTKAVRPLFTMEASARQGGRLRINFEAGNLDTFKLSRVDREPFFPAGVNHASWVAAWSIIYDLFPQLLLQNGLPTRRVYYLPAARSGVLQGWQMLASLAVDTMRRRAGLRPVSVPPLSGVPLDFVQTLLALTARPRPQKGAESMQAALGALEKNILRGVVSMRSDSEIGAQLIYESDGLELPVSRASSMVAELAPLGLWIKYLLRPGDLLILDEPEAHLHPENQRQVARVLVRLVRAGVRVICPTHSSLFVHQISNQILASQLGEAARAEHGYSKEDLITSDEVAVYFFKPEDDGTRIQPVPISNDFGISEESFLPVSEAIGDETYRLSRALEESAVGG